MLVETCKRYCPWYEHSKHTSIDHLLVHGSKPLFRPSCCAENHDFTILYLASVPRAIFTSIMTPGHVGPQLARSLFTCTLHLITALLTCLTWSFLPSPITCNFSPNQQSSTFLPRLANHLRLDDKQRPTVIREGWRRPSVSILRRPLRSATARMRR
ncbi:hypothetical protein BDV97DRAFT_51913 [Delphinella strobiligena]|nr:hypothetical protein BDV97DRAFT_51913 [Delphinella strobiligena]